MDHHPRLVAFDLDGTLAESKQRMSAEMGELLARLLKKMPVAIMSGAGFPQFEKQFFTALPMESKLLNLYIFPDDAAQCFVYRGVWRAQYDNSFGNAEKEKILKIFDETMREVNYPTPPKTWGEQLEDRGAEIAFSALGQQAPLDAKEFWHREHEGARDDLRNALVKNLPDFSVTEGGLTTIQITRKGITKAYGIKRLSELTSIPIAQMLYVGDALEEGGNDAVVKDTGVPTHQVFGPEETAGLITSLLK